jgi:hypothetical protein
MSLDSLKLGMGEQEINKVLKLANSHHLEHVQWKVEYLRTDIDVLEVQKAILYRIIDEFQETLNNSNNFASPILAGILIFLTHQ